MFEVCLVWAVYTFFPLATSIIFNCIALEIINEGIKKQLVVIKQRLLTEISSYLNSMGYFYNKEIGNDNYCSLFSEIFKFFRGEREEGEREPELSLSRLICCLT